MSVGVWDPDGKKAAISTVSRDLLDRFCACARDMDESIDLTVLAQHELAGHAGVMKLDPDAWQAAENLSSEDMVCLIRFFTLIEMQVPEWDAGRKSPVIPLVALLKARGEFDADLRKWIKSSTSNRYLPHGSAL